ncbi:MAG TPA: SH3 domain-containing protein [Thiotrichales bacterium]|nr:SH3 domain-containing protein [Thiotrichales bacterium]
MRYLAGSDAEPVEGWVRVAHLALIPELGKLPIANGEINTPRGENQAAIRAAVTAKRLNLRAGPGLDRRIVDVLLEGEQVEVLERSDNRAWLQVRTLRLRVT